jgi:glycerophosphoryl diester phosphodiesterase
LDRTTDGVGLVRRTPLEILRSFDAGGHYAPEFRGQKIPTLAEVFEKLGKQMVINVELTNYSTPGDQLVDCVVDLVRTMNLHKQVIFSSFYPKNLVRARALLPEVPLVLLHLGGTIGKLTHLLFSRVTPHDIVGINQKNIKPEIIRRAHKERRRIFVYTINNCDQMRRLVNLGVDGLITDDPVMGLKVVRGEMG